MSTPEYAEVSQDKVVRLYGYSRSQWIAGICFCACIGVVLFTVIAWSFVGVRTRDNEHHVQDIEMRLMTEKHSDFTTDGLYALGKLYKSLQPTTLALCHLALYNASLPPAPPGEPLGRVSDTLEHIIQSKNGHAYYVVKAYFNIEYNANPYAMGFDLQRLGLDQNDERYQLIHYELASNYLDFSTVKLLESELDLHSHTIKPKREFLVCTNNPRLEGKRCSMQWDGLWLMNNTRLLHMDRPLVDDSVPAESHNETKTYETYDNKDGRGIDLTLEYKENLRPLAESISHLTMYHLLFYRQLPPFSREDESFREYLLLRAEPNKC